MTKKCKNCGSHVNDGAKFCPQCGTLINTDQPRVGILTIKWRGLWMLVDAKVHIWANRDYIGSYSFKKGFEVSVPITTAKMLIGIKCSIRSYQSVLNVNPSEDYTLHLIYSRFIGGYDFMLCDKSEKRIM